MKSLHEKIAALFRKGSPVSANAELTFPLPLGRGRPCVSNCCWQHVTEEGTENVDDRPSSTSQGTIAEQTSSPWTGWI